jgi:hypothetical protein
MTVRGTAGQPSGSAPVTVDELRAMVGAVVVIDTPREHLEGTLVSCTRRSAWLVCGDEDRVVALPEVRAAHRR